MTSTEHSLFDYDPELYRLIHVGTPGDVEFYRSACYGAGSVLELGCGWGRITRAIEPVAESVVGLDVNPLMIEAARDNLDESHEDIEFVVGDMRDFDLARRFERILIPYNSLYNLLSRDDVEACLRCVREHLDEDGVLIFDGYYVDASMRRDMERVDGVDHDFIGGFEHGGRYIEVYEKSTYDVPARRFDATYVYRLHRDDGTSESVEFHIPQRFALAEEIDEVLESVGLYLESLTGDFEGEPLGSHHAQMVVAATR